MKFPVCVKPCERRRERLDALQSRIDEFLASPAGEADLRPRLTAMRDELRREKEAEALARHRQLAGPDLKSYRGT